MPASFGELTKAERAPHRLRVTAGLILGLFLAALEATVVATAMPRVIQDLGGVQLYSLPFALYLLMATVSGPIWGRASDLYGRRRLYLTAVGLFLLGSALSGAARSMPMLIGARALQGLGGGGLQTLTFTLVGELYPLRDRAQVQGWISGVWGFSALVGPLVGGLIVDHFSWRWVFYLNLPFGLAAMSLVGGGIPEARPKSGVSLDLGGAALFVLGAGALIYSLELESPPALILAALAMVGFAIFERHQALPLIPFPDLRRPFAFRGFLGNLLGGMAFFGMTAYIPLFAQVARGQSATVGGLLLSPMTVGWTVSSVLTARWLPRWGPRPLARWGPVAMIAGFGAWAMARGAPLPLLGFAGLVVGAGMGVMMLALLVCAQEEAPREVLGIVTGMLLFARNIGGSMGAAVMGAALGPALTVGGEALLTAFWKIPALALGLSLGLLWIGLSVPDLPGRAAGPLGEQELVVGMEK
ncbi:Multidrug resistance protein 3 [Candidatus Thermoflexus japonica]|uniref:MFS-type drug efflux transporter P55 n=1 Tax=Candidatus Thermoflexus japonica TaxID=2035417 RepID=A0A2H5Y9A6_9CHLR|nr:Multidrug resistance protein 3 [Candidatus Thermoflexus japonica]